VTQAADTHNTHGHESERQTYGEKNPVWTLTQEIGQVVAA